MAKSSEFHELVKGASINQLAELFDLDRRTVTSRLRGIAPSGYRNTFPIYRIIEAAPLLLHGYMTDDQVSEAQKRQHADKEKDYWDARLKEQKYRENMGDLWRTEKVVSVFAEVFKQFRESVVVFNDAMEHESGLEPKQIEKTKAFSDALLVELREKLMVLEIDPQGDHEPPVESDTDDELRELGLL